MTRPSWQDFATHDESIVPELWDGVVGAWAPCLGPTGSRLHDMSRRANWGTLTNMDPLTDWVVDGGQYALDFDGSNDHIQLGSGSYTYPNPRAFTWNFWVRFTALTQSYSALVETLYAFAYQAACMVKSNGKLAYYIMSSNGSTESNYDGQGAYTLSINNWYMLTFTYSGALRQAGYVNANLDGVSTTTPVASIGQPSNVVCFGRSVFETGRYPQVQMAEAIIWNRALSDGEIYHLYQLGRGGMYQRRRRSRIYIPQAGFQAAWARRQNQIIGGGL